MPVHIGFLRAVNVGGRQYRTADLRSALVAAGFTEVDTWIQTGNIRVTSPLRSGAKVAAELERVFLADRGFEVRTIVVSPAELTRLALDADEVAAACAFRSGHYLSLLQEAPSPEDAAVIEGFSVPGERFVVRGKAVHQLYDIPFNEARRIPAAVARAFGVSTNRNAKVIYDLAERWGAGRR